MSQNESEDYEKQYKSKLIEKFISKLSNSNFKINVQTA